jgi:SAM-dependent methyltransferase
VDDYVAYRPGYPVAVLELLERECGLRPTATVADVGSGTGKLTELLLTRAGRVCAVEPNGPMRAAAERQLGGRPGFVSLDGRAERTGLEPHSVDLVTASQAFHWFDPGPTRAEFRRILVPGGFVALIWNNRSEDSPYLAEYEQFLRQYSVDYEQADHRRTSPRQSVAAFFAGSPLREAEFPNPQELDLAAVQGAYRSTSYSLRPDHPRFPEAMVRLAELFDRHQRGGRVTSALRCRVYWGRL